MCLLSSEVNGRGYLALSQGLENYNQPDTYLHKYSLTGIQPHPFIGMVSKQSADPCSRQAFRDAVFLCLPASLSSGSLSILQAGRDFGGGFFFFFFFLGLGVEVLSNTPTCIYWPKLMATCDLSGMPEKSITLVSR